MLAYSGRGRFVVAPLDLSQAVRDQAALLQTSASRKALLSLELADGLPPILADAAQVRQVVLNLALNASEALGERPGSVAVRTGRAWRSRGHCAAPTRTTSCRRGNTSFLRSPTRAAAWTPRRSVGCSSRSSRRSSSAAGWAWRRCWASCAATRAPSS